MFSLRSPAPSFAELETYKRKRRRQVRRPERHRERLNPIASNNPDEFERPVKVVQELMRHANISTTMNVYTKALTPAKREAQSRVVDVLIDRSRKVAEDATEDAA